MFSDQKVGKACAKEQVGEGGAGEKVDFLPREGIGAQRAKLEWENSDVKGG